MNEPTNENPFPAIQGLLNNIARNENESPKLRKQAIAAIEKLMAIEQVLLLRATKGLKDKIPSKPRIEKLA